MGSLNPNGTPISQNRRIVRRIGDSYTVNSDGQNVSTTPDFFRPLIATSGNVSLGAHKNSFGVKIVSSVSDSGYLVAESGFSDNTASAPSPFGGGAGLSGIYCSMHLSVNQTGVANGSDVKVNLDGITIDPFGIASTGNGRIVASEILNGRVVQILGNVMWSDPGPVFQSGEIVYTNVSHFNSSNVLQNKYTEISNVFGSTGPQHQVQSEPIEVSTGDYFELSALHTNASNRTFEGSAGPRFRCFMTLTTVD